MRRRVSIVYEAAIQREGFRVAAVYQVSTDTRYQTLLGDNDLIVAAFSRPLIGGARVGAKWNPMRTRIRDLAAPRGIVFPIGGSLFVTTGETPADVLNVLAQDGEELPLFVDDEQSPGTLWNFPLTLAALDEQSTEYRVYPSGMRGLPLKFQFLRQAFDRAALFKERTLPSSMLFAVSGIGDPEQDFVKVCQRHGATGLTFKPLWECAE